MFLYKLIFLKTSYTKSIKIFIFLVPRGGSMTKTKIARELLGPFKLTFMDIRKHDLEAHEIKMIIENNKQYPELFIKSLLAEVHQGEVKGR